MALICLKACLASLYCTRPKPRLPEPEETRGRNAGVAKEPLLGPAVTEVTFVSSTEGKVENLHGYGTSRTALGLV
ncbi:hypothetical protein SKAU_G00163900 [Synaphobranchus kaupii]|uniref:Uncharacterized protein n=1 Tax=Synaphobranchus kaupii TaxID=118154 RepID=A0A9Q1J010_SYNKA|nr:hypothetical protein SKAU_G00163900 [Synaphobranchus kaupii]